MRQLSRPRPHVGELALGVVISTAMFCAGCSTVLRPTRPDTPLAADGAASVAAVRFDGASTVLREPGMPLSPSRSWQREIANYTANSLNTVLSTSDAAPVAKTVVTFDLSSPSVIQIGTWKEISIQLASTMPDGSVVKSAPVVGNIDNTLEYALVTAASVGGTVLDATAAIAILVYVVSAPSPAAPLIGVVALGALLGGVTLHIAQSAGGYVIAANEEKRWSNLFAQAIRAHAVDVRAAVAKGLGTPKATPTQNGKPDPADPSAPPPLLELGATEL